LTVPASSATAKAAASSDGVKAEKRLVMPLHSDSSKPLHQQNKDEIFGRYAASRRIFIALHMRNVYHQATEEGCDSWPTTDRTCK
jgi:hypothetical protein